MNVHIIGHHVEVTQALHDHVVQKMARIKKHFDHVLDVHVILKIEKHVHRAEATIHVAGKDVHAHADESDLYVAIDHMAVTIDRAIVKIKDRKQNHHHLAAKRMAA